MAERFKKRRHILDEHLRQRHPEVFNLIEHLRESDDSN
jgi:SulP family sulfate permease